MVLAMHEADQCAVRRACRGQHPCAIAMPVGVHAIGRRDLHLLVRIRGRQVIDVRSGVAHHNRIAQKGQPARAVRIGQKGKDGIVNVIGFLSQDGNDVGVPHCELRRGILRRGKRNK